MKYLSFTLAFSREKWSERRGFFFDSYSPFWFRGYVQSDTLGHYLAFILSKHKAMIHVVGHTPGPSIRSKYKGKLIATNVSKFGTEMLLLVRNKKKYRRYKIDSDGNVTKLDLVTK